MSRGFEKDICINCNEIIVLVRKDIRRGWYHPEAWTDNGHPDFAGTKMCKGQVHALNIKFAEPAKGVAVVSGEEAE